MRITVLLFANLAEAVGSDQLAIELGATAVVSDALEALAKEHIAIASMRNSLAIAVDERYAHAGSPLHDGCTLALIPPVSGG